jgi:hypothetical protein
LLIPLKHLNRPGTPKLWAITHENAIKRKKQRVFAHTSQTCKSRGTPILWAITHENGHKTQKDEFLFIPLKHVNCPGTPKLWAITHENTKQMRFWSSLSNT